MAYSIKRSVRFWSVLGVLIFTLIVFTTFSSAQEIEFKDVKKKGILKDKVLDTANMYADVLQFDVIGKVKDTFITETINVLIPKGQMTPGEIMLENIYGLITIGAGPEFLILKEILISENRRKAVMKGVEQSIYILADLVQKGTPALNPGSKIINEKMKAATGAFADLIIEIKDVLIQAIGPERRAYERVMTVIPDRPPLLYPGAMKTVHQLCDGPWVFIWAEPRSPHGVKEYLFQLRNPNTREIMLETTVKENYVVIPQQNRTFSGRKQLYWAWSVKAIGSDSKEGLTTEGGFYVKEIRN